MVQNEEKRNENKEEKILWSNAKLRKSDSVLWKLFFRLWDVFMNREMIAYLISGVLTTLVNWVLYYLLAKKLGIEELTANAVDWVLTVAFAYVVNALWVFQSRFSGAGDEVKKVAKFYGARLLTFVVEEGGMFLLVKILLWPDLIVKAGLAVIVIILNYIFSKLFVFLKK